MAKKLKITQVKSAIGRFKNQKLTIKALGIRKRGRSVIHTDSPSIRGMIRTVQHLVDITEVEGE
ncbi:MAG: 50S ribosomal protein L30 [Chitinivibrionales bacterium]|nr:50S ribosomal protein L30 [Chitinivibrionales bacterium]